MKKNQSVMAGALSQAALQGGILVQLNNPGAEVYVPDSIDLSQAVWRTTHLAIGAHQDDIEIMACEGINKCFAQADQWFTAVVVTNGAGSPRTNIYAGYTDQQMQQVRRLEQKKAAFIGEYGAAILLDYPSSAVKNPADDQVITDLQRIISTAKPRVIYTHNLADKHDTHIGVAAKVIAALRGLPKKIYPQQLYGCEVWRGLDWLNDDEKIMLDASDRPNLAAALLEVYDSQVSGGKRYDLATVGRRMANATFAASHSTDVGSSYVYAVNLRPLIEDPSLDFGTYMQGFIQRFATDVAERLRRLT